MGEETAPVSGRSGAQGSVAPAGSCNDSPTRFLVLEEYRREPMIIF